MSQPDARRKNQSQEASAPHGFWTDNLIFGTAAFLSGGFNYLYHVVLAHVLGPGGYGDLTTFLNVTSVLLLPAPVITLIYTRLGNRRRLPRPVLLWAGGVALWGILILLSASLARTLHVQAWILIIYSFEVVPSLVLAANIGLLQRAEWYLWVGMINVANNGFRVVAAAGSAWLGFPLAALGGLEGIAAWVSYWASGIAVRRLPHLAESVERGLVVGTATVGTLNVLFSLADGLIAKYRLGPEAAGWFNGLATIGHSVQFLSGSLGTVMLTSILADPDRRANWLAITLGLYGLLGLGAEWVFHHYGQFVVHTILGRSFFSIVPVLGDYGWGMVAAGFLNILMLYAVAIRRWSVIITTGLGFIVWVVTLFAAHRLFDFVQTTMVVMLCTLGLTALVLTWGVMHPPRQSGEA